jgi:SAM-dependent methyltransferase
MDQFDSDFALHWDELVGWERRAAAETDFISGLLAKFGCKSVLDVALGTGFHSIELLKRGMRVKSVDVSPAMIEVARKNAVRHGVALDAACADWAELEKTVKGKFDSVLCLGNSLACEMDPGKRQQAVRNWGRVLSENGVVIVDRRNYETLLNNEYNFTAPGQYFGTSVKIASRKIAADGTIFSYTFSDGKTFKLDMYPLKGIALESLFRNADMGLIETYGDRQLDHTGKDVGFYTSVFGKSRHA